jgi:type I restriction enzyme R subunit
MTPEQTAREQIDTQLGRCGWTVQTKDKINLSASHGVAVCKLSFANGEPDYILFVAGNLQRATRLSQSILQKAFTENSHAEEN